MAELNDLIYHFSNDGLNINVEIRPLVKCKECKWWDKVDNIDGVNYGTCERKCTAIRQDAFPNENWFCADGERKNENE